MRRISKPLANSHSHAALPFGEPQADQSSQRAKVHIANVDGASRGNPGPASYGLIVRGPDGATVFEIGKYLGRATNNVAEYYALIAALDYAASHAIASLRVESDSELLVRQMQGRYKVKSPDLRPLHERAQKLARGIEHFTIAHVPREHNRDADALANLALDNTSSSGARSAVAAAPTLPSATQMAAQSTPQQAARPVSPMGEQRVTKTIKARYSARALHPLEALDLAEGEVVEVRISRNVPA